jgi:hypothetical protein
MSEQEDNLLVDKVKGYAPLNLDECQGLASLSNDDFETDKLMGDLLKVEYIDELPTGEVNRGGIFIKQEMGTRLWRIGKVIKRGAMAPEEIQEGTLVRFPSDKGIPCVSSGKKYVYLNAERIFETVVPKKKD